MVNSDRRTWAIRARSQRIYSTTAVVLSFLVFGRETSSGGEPRGGTGPDVIVGDLMDTNSYGTENGISAFAVGTVSCNLGTSRLSWIQGTNQHPVIAQNMYRLKDGRFEQVGMSWLKHGYFALSECLCVSCGGSNQCDDATNGTELGVGCSDPYVADLNGSRNRLGPRYQVNPHTGEFTFPPASPSYSQTIGRRLQVHNTDLDPASNAQAAYFVEGQYVTPDDAAAGNNDNNASYRRISVSQNGNSYSISLRDATVRTEPAIRAWGVSDPTVRTTEVRVPNEGLFVLAAKVTAVGNGYWNYEYAIQNINSDRSLGGFRIPLAATALIQNIGFHDVDYHSGEPFDGANWTALAANGYLAWSTTPYDSNPNANALRWGTLYNFRFDCNRAPNMSGSVIFDLFKPGTPSIVETNTIVPGTTVCGNGVVEPGETCDPPNATTCNENCQPMGLFEDDLETNKGWITSSPSDTASTGRWERVNPIGTAAQPEDDHTPAPGTLCFITGQQPQGSTDAGANDVDAGRVTLFTPIISIGRGDVAVSYWRWFSNNSGARPNEDLFTVDISYDGGQSWQLVERVGPTGPEVGGNWFLHSFEIPDAVSTEDRIQVRFIAEDAGTGGSIVEAAIDDFRIEPRSQGEDCNTNGIPDSADIGGGTSADCDANAVPDECDGGPVGPPSGDPNGDGRVDGEDVALVAQAMISPDPSAAVKCALDFDADGQIGTADLPGFVAFILGL